MHLKLSFHMFYSKNYAVVSPYWTLKILCCWCMESDLALWWGRHVGVLITLSDMTLLPFGSVFPMFWQNLMVVIVSPKLLNLGVKISIWESLCSTLSTLNKSCRSSLEVLEWIFLEWIRSILNLFHSLYTVMGHNYSPPCQNSLKSGVHF